MNRFIGRGLPFKQLSIQLTRVRDGSPVRLTELQLHPKKSPSLPGQVAHWRSVHLTGCGLAPHNLVQSLGKKLHLHVESKTMNDIQQASIAVVFLGIVTLIVGYGIRNPKFGPWIVLACIVVMLAAIAHIIVTAPA